MYFSENIFRKNFWDIQLNNGNQVGYFYNNDKKIIFPNHTFTTETINELLLFLEKYPEIQQLNLVNNKITNEDAILLAKNKTLKILELCNNSFNDEVIISFANNNTLISLNLSFNQVSNNAISRLIAENKTLIDLKLSGCRLDDNIASAVSKNTTLKKLDLNSNFITDKGCHYFALNNSIEWLNISSNLLGLKSAELLRDNTAINWLDISNNPIGDKGLRALVLNKNIRSLYVRICGISEDVSRIISKNYTLINVDFSGNNCGNISIDLAQKLNYNLQNFKFEIGTRAALTYFGLLLLNRSTSRNGLPTLPEEVIDLIINYANTFFSDELSRPLPSIQALRTDATLVTNIRFFIPINKPPKVTLKENHSTSSYDKKLMKDHNCIIQ